MILPSARRLWQAMRHETGADVTPLTAAIALVLPFGWLVFLVRSRVVRAFARVSTCF